MSEASLWNYLRKVLPKEGHYSRIESPTSQGFPDVHFTLHGVSGTIELKSTKRPKTKYPFSGKDGLRRSQITWIEDEIESSGWVLLCLACGDYIYLLKADLYYDDLHKMSIDEIAHISKMYWNRRKNSPDIEQLGDVLLDE